METPIKGVTTGRIQLGLTKSLAAIYQRVTRMSSQNVLPYELFTNGIPYEALRTYRAMKTEFEHNQSQAVIEVHRQAIHGF